MENSNQHFDNIKNGEKIIIEGKTYVKVQLQFVDTLSPITTRQVEILVSENIFLQEKIELLKEKIAYYEKSFEQLNVLNKNLVAENKEIRGRYKSKAVELEQQYQKAIKNYVFKANMSYNEKIKSLKEKYKYIENNIKLILKAVNPINNSQNTDIDKANNKIEELETQILIYKKTIENQKKEMLELKLKNTIELKPFVEQFEQLIKDMELFNNGNENIKVPNIDEENGFNKKELRLVKKIEELENEVIEKDTLIKTLTKKFLKKSF